MGQPIAPKPLQPATTAKRKRREVHIYEKRVVRVEHGSFIPIVLSSTGGMGPSATIFYKRLASLITSKHAYAASYSATMRMI